MLKQQGENLILSYPRSGNSWVRYIVEVISGRKTLGCETNPSDTPIAPSVEHDIGVDMTKPAIARKFHLLWITDHKAHNNERNNLLLIIRNYKECVVRQNSGNETLLFRIFQRQTNGCDGIFPPPDYINPIKSYELWRGDKDIVYYEDLMDNPKKEIEKIVELFGLDENKIDDFMENYEYHRNNSIGGYSAVRGQSVSDGKAKFHFKFGEDAERKWDTHLWRYHRDICETYLKRYKLE